VIAFVKRTDGTEGGQKKGSGATVRTVPSKSRMWSVMISPFSSACRWDRSVQSRRPNIYRRGGSARQEGASRHEGRREPSRCSRSGVEDPTDGNARRNSGTLGGRRRLRVSPRWSSVTGRLPYPRRAAPHHVYPIGGAFQSVAVLFDIARPDLGRSRASFSAIFLQRVTTR